MPVQTRLMDKKVNDKLLNNDRKNLEIENLINEIENIINLRNQNQLLKDQNEILLLKIKSIKKLHFNLLLKKYFFNFLIIFIFLYFLIIGFDFYILNTLN